MRKVQEDFTIPLDLRLSLEVDAAWCELEQRIPLKRCVIFEEIQGILCVLDPLRCWTRALSSQQKLECHLLAMPKCVKFRKISRFLWIFIFWLWILAKPKCVTSGRFHESVALDPRRCWTRALRWEFILRKQDARALSLEFILREGNARALSLEFILREGEARAMSLEFILREGDASIPLEIQQDRPTHMHFSALSTALL